MQNRKTKATTCVANTGAADETRRQGSQSHLQYSSISRLGPDWVWADLAELRDVFGSVLEQPSDVTQVQRLGACPITTLHFGSDRVLDSHTKVQGYG
jgi:hypothetical protein